jgi:acyl-homoserine lactone acylase PvdQ
VGAGELIGNARIGVPDLRGSYATSSHFDRVRFSQHRQPYCEGGNEAPSADALARAVTIYRDTYGTPHVFGKSDASPVFGLAYAQAEDNFAQLEQDFALAIGRGAEIYGTELLDDDRLNCALEIEQFAKSDYDTLDPKMRSLCEAFAAGINFYLQHHPNVQPKLLAGSNRGIHWRSFVTATTRTGSLAIPSWEDRHY